MGAPGGRGTSTVSNIHWPAIVLWAPGWHVHESHWWKQLPTGQWVQDPAGPVQAMPPLLDEHPPLALDRFGKTMTARAMRTKPRVEMQSG